MTAQDVIRRIRNRWGVGLPETIDSDAMETIEHLRSQHGNALVLLAGDLYQSETHFFLELLQNADDNEYADGTIPELVVVVEAERLTFRNNETGFTAENACALCAVGNSTKKARKSVQIGEKGVGFKAVFQVSDRPEIHSNGFHFRFDRVSDNRLGMVIPHWIEGHAASEGGVGTTLILPLKSPDSFRVDLGAQVRPELLLFLRRLRRIAIDDRTRGTVLELVRSDDGDVIEIRRTLCHGATSTASNELFFVHRRSVDMKDVEEKQRPAVRETEVVIALPIGPAGDANEREERPVYSFLPVRSVGFGFVAHADFVLVTNREDVRAELAWNIRLRDELAIALADAILASQRRDVLGRTALRFLRSPHEVGVEFFRAVMDDAISLLKARACVPCGPGRYAQPGACLRSDALRLSTLVDAKVLDAALGRALVDPNVDRSDAPWALLGCEVFRVKDLIRCLQHPQWTASKDAAWFGSLLGALGRDGAFGASDEPALRDCAIIRLTDGSTVAPKSDIFTHLDQRTSYGFESTLRLLDPVVLDSLDGGRRAIATALLDRWGIRLADPVAIISQCILPQHGSVSGKKLGRLVLQGHLRYVRDHLDVYLRSFVHVSLKEKAIARLSETLWIATSRSGAMGESYERAKSLYLSPELGLTKLVIDIVGDSIADCMVGAGLVIGEHLDDRERDCKLWERFLKRIGVHGLPRVFGSGDDWDQSPELSAAMSSDSPARKLALLDLVQSNWSHFEPKMRRPIGGVQPTAPSSAFCKALRSMTVPTIGGRQAAIGSCFLDRDENKAVFGGSVDYFAPPWNNDSFLRFLGVGLLPTVEQAIERLDAIRGDDRLDLAARIQDAKRLYSFLNSRFETAQVEIAAAFREKKLILTVEGGADRWYRLADASWEVAPALRNYCQAGCIKVNWPQFDEFFREKLGVRSELTADELVSALGTLATDREVDPEQATRTAVAVYRLLSERLDSSVKTGDGATWVARLANERNIRIRGGRWCKDGANVFVADDSLLEECFQDRDAIRLVDVVLDELPAIESLLRLWKVERLSHAVVSEPPEAGPGARRPQVAKQLSARWRHLARYLWHKQVKCYRRACSDGKLACLRQFEVSSCRPLLVTADLVGETASVRRAAWCDLADGGARLYLDEDSSIDWDQIGIEICRVLGLEETDGPNLGRLFGEPSDARCETFLAKLKVSDLPDAERDRWGEAVDQAPDFEEPDSGIDWDEEHALLASQTSTGDPPTEKHATPEVERGDGSDGEPEASSDNAEAVIATDSASTGAVSRSRDPEVDADFESGRVHRSGGSDVDLSATEAQSVLRDASAPGRGGGGPRVGMGGNSTDRPGIAGPRQPDAERAGAESSSHSSIPSSSSAGGRRASERPQQRLISYVSHDDRDEDEEFSETAQAHEQRLVIGDAAVRFVLEQERSIGREAEGKHQLHPGYDVESRASAGEDLRHVEVKGTASAWADRGVFLTANQFRFALDHPDTAWLYVVEFALDPARRQLWRIRSPAKAVTRHGFDRGWVMVAEADALVLPLPAVGTRWRLKGGREGLIASIDGQGAQRGVTVQMPDGPPMRELLTPDRLRDGPVEEP
jgi:hypothetical protein